MRVGRFVCVLLSVNKMSAMLLFCLHNVKRCNFGVFLIYDVCFCENAVFLLPFSDNAGCFLMFLP